MSKRIDGTLPKLSASNLPKRLLFFDTETFVEEYPDNTIRFPFRSLCSIYVEIDKSVKVLKREVEFFYSREEFFRYILDKLDKRSILYIFAHNIAFDLRTANIFHQALALDKNNEPPIINSLVFIWSLNHNGLKAKFLDTANFGVRSVKQLGKDLGIEKLEIDFNTATDEELEAYNKRDTELLEIFMLNYLRFIHNNNLGGFKLTLAAQSLTAYRTSFYKENIVIHSHKGATDLERDAYYGGRTEIFRYGQQEEQEYFMLDVNSMYPYIMKNSKVPVKLVGYSDYNPNNRILELLEKYYVIADVSIECDENFIPYRLRKDRQLDLYLKNPYNLPYPDSKNYNLMFPIGRFRTILHHAELLQLVGSGHIIKIHRVAWYDSLYIFGDYVDFFYAKKLDYKKKQNKSYYLMSKLFQNSLYGKFGQIEPHREYLGFNTEERFERYPEYDEVNQVYTNKLTWNWRIFNEYKQGETSFSYPAISGAITAYARMYLYNLYVLAGKNNSYYTDTDSLIINREGYNNLSSLLSKEELGKLDIDKQANQLTIFGNKDYQLGDKTVHKGVPIDASKISGNEWRYIQFEGFITSWRLNTLGEARGEYKIKSRITTYNKGIINPDGTISPYIFKEF